MKGVGPYNDWSYYSSPSSNLSAFAPPFAVNRSTSNAPFVDLAPPSGDAVPPPIHFPAVSRSYGYDFLSNPVGELESTPSPKPYGFSGLQVMDSSSGTQLPHFNPLGLASKDALAYDQCSSNGTKSGVAEAQPYYPSYVSSPTPIHDLNSSVAPPNHWPSSSGYPTLDGTSVGDYAKKPSEMPFSGQRGGLWNFADFNQGKSRQVDVGSSFSSNQTYVTGSVVQESLINQGYQDVKDSNNGEALHMTGWEKHSVPVSAAQLDDKTCCWETIQSMPVEFSSTSVMGSPSMSPETHYEQLPLLGQQAKPRVDGSSAPITGLVKDLGVCNNTADGDLGSNNFYNMKEARRMASPGTAGFFDLGQLHMNLERNEPTLSNDTMISENSISKDVVDYIFKETHASPDNLSLQLGANDRSNPAVDSPCWKGVSSAHFSHYEVSKALHHQNEKCFGSIIQGPENSNSHQQDEIQETSSKFSLSKFAPENFNSNGAVNAGSFQSESSCDCGLQYLDNSSEMKENIVYDCVLKASHTEHGTSHATEHAEVDAPKLEKSEEKLSTQMLVDRMLNLSKLLDARELKEQDCNALKNLISNVQQALLSYEQQQNTSFERSQLTKGGAEKTEVELKSSLNQEAKNCHVRSEKPHWKFSDSFSPRGDAEMKKEDKMTEALKRILSENFPHEEGEEPQTVLYKNLWLEAEAALCSISYRARYNQMKIDMEKYSHKQIDNALDLEEQSKPEVVPRLSTSQISATKVCSDRNPDSSAQGSPVLNATTLNEQSGLKFSADLNKPNALTSERKGCLDLDSSIQNSAVSATNNETRDNEASVMARFQLLKAGDDKSCINTANLEELSDIADKLAYRGRDNQNQVNFCQDSPIPEKKMANDYEASVMARFHILQSRVEDSSSISSEGSLLGGFGFAGKGIDGTITKNASEGRSLDVHINVDNKIPKQILEELSGAYRSGNQLPNYHSDGIASDWEHV